MASCPRWFGRDAKRPGSVGCHASTGGASSITDLGLLGVGGALFISKTIRQDVNTKLRDTELCVWDSDCHNKARALRGLHAHALSR